MKRLQILLRWIEDCYPASQLSEHASKKAISARSVVKPIRYYRFLAAISLRNPWAIPEESFQQMRGQHIVSASILRAN